MFVCGHVTWVDTLWDGIAKGRVGHGVKGVDVLDTFDQCAAPFLTPCMWCG